MAATIIILAVLVIIVVFAIRGSRKHFGGEGGCCGGGSSTVEDVKELEGKKIGEIIVRIDGMHCDNCKNRVQRALNRVDGASAKVNLKKKEAVVSYDRPVSDEDLKRAVENEDYTVVSIEDRPLG